MSRTSRTLKTPRVLLLLSVLGSSLAASNPTAFNGAMYPTKIDTFMRQALCSNQLAMCAASCQSEIQLNDCDSETLAWTCLCKEGTVKTFKDWQLPIPFKLCSSDLWACLQSCPTADKEQPVASTGVNLQSGHQQSRMAMMSGGGGNDFDQDDYDALEEIRLLRHGSKLERASYNRFEKDGARRSMLNAKKKQFHMWQWAKQRREILAVNRKQLETDDESFTGQSTAFNIVSHPALQSASACASTCQSSFACGTESAPEYISAPKQI